MSEMGKAMMGTGEAEGEGRAVKAAEAAISNPLLDDASMKGARGVLINITGGPDMTLFEVDEAANRIRDEVDPEANIIFGATTDDTLQGFIRVSVVATGIDGTGIGHNPAPAAVESAKKPTVAPADETETLPEAEIAGDNNTAEEPLALEPAMAPPPRRESVPAQTGVSLAVEEEREPQRPARSSIWSMLTGGDRTKPAKTADARPAAKKRDDIFVPPAPVVAPREVISAESTVRPIESAPPPANNKNVANGVAAMFGSANGTPRPAQAPAAPVEKTPEPQQAAYASSEDILEIPAFLRRQAN